MIYHATCEVLNNEDRVLSRAEHSCSSEEVLKRRDGSTYFKWKDARGKPEEFAIKSMAQTRALGKALRLPLGWIVSLAGYKATPAEEMPPSIQDSVEVEYTIKDVNHEKKEKHSSTKLTKRERKSHPRRKWKG